MRRAQLLSAAVPHASHTSVQWFTLAWIIGAAVAAAVIIAIIVLVSRRPKSMEHGIAEFSRSLQAVAPNHRGAPRTASGGHVRTGAATVPPAPGQARARGEGEVV
jgi:hypothetical protein